MKKPMTFFAAFIALLVLTAVNIQAQQKFALEVVPVPSSIPANMIRIQGGTFTMGSPANEPERNSNETQHQVTVSGFYMGKYPVTQEEYQEVIGTNPSYFIGDSLLVESVSWNDAMEFCNKLSIREGFTPVYCGSNGNITCDWNANGYRLPTEAEWEFAAKGGTKEYITTEYSGSNSVEAVAWYSVNSGNRTHPVGTKAANSLGIYDMNGNVWEWCWRGNYGSGAQTDSISVIRGGSWESSAEDIRSGFQKSYVSIRSLSSAVGFRLVHN
jgi:formylglycine-generating enzyme required for sulfatase activity